MQFRIQLHLGILVQCQVDSCLVENGDGDKISVEEVLRANFIIVKEVYISNGNL